VNRRVTHAVVLSRVNYGEADRIVTLLTETNGVVTVMAKGARRLKSKLAGGVEPFSQSEITYIPGKNGLSTLVSAKMISHYSNVSGDFERVSQGYDYLKWIKKYVEEESGDQGYYAVLVAALELLNDSSKDSGLAYCYFYLNTLRLEGLAPDPYRDSSGQKLAAATAYTFDHESSTFVPADNGPFRQAEVKFIRVLLGDRGEVAKRISTKNVDLPGIQQLVRQHLTVVEQGL